MYVEKYKYVCVKSCSLEDHSPAICSLISRVPESWAGLFLPTLPRHKTVPVYLASAGGSSRRSGPPRRDCPPHSCSAVTPCPGESQSPADPRPVNTLHVTELVTRDTAWQQQHSITRDTEVADTQWGTRWVSGDTGNSSELGTLVAKHRSLKFHNHREVPY